MKFLTGKQFGRWTVLSLKPRGKYHDSRWWCKCSCGEEREVSGWCLESGESKSCGCYHREVISARLREKHPRWKGGRWKEGCGYIKVLNPDGTKSLEHRNLMEGILGRTLQADETVHHKNGRCDDNRLENLELWAGRHCKGQRVSDLIAHAKEILRQYEPGALR